MSLWYLIFLLDECLRLVNLLRRLHINTPSVSWSDEFATVAQNYVNKLVNSLKTGIAEDVFKASGRLVFGLKGSRKASCADALLKW